MKVSEVTPEWIRLRARTKGLRLYALAKAIPMERTKLSKSLNRKRNFLGWELARLVELLDDSPAVQAANDPDIMELLEDYLKLSGSDRLRARALLRALRSVASPECRQQSAEEADKVHKRMLG